MAEVPFAQKRAHPRFLFVADPEISLRDGTSIPPQIDELSARGCYLGTLEPIPIGTEFRLRIWKGIGACELEGKVIYEHPGNTLGICRMGVLFGRMATEQRSVIDAWLHELAGEHAASSSASLGP